MFGLGPIEILVLAIVLGVVAIVVIGASLNTPSKPQPPNQPLKFCPKCGADLRDHDSAKKSV